jgi:hypothetical protein
MPPRSPSTGLFGKSVDQIMQTVTLPAFKKKGFIHTRLIAEWEQVAGKELAALCHPIEVKFPRGKKDNGTLVLMVDSGSALMIQHQQGLLLEKLAIYFGYRAITKLVLKHQPLPIRAAMRKKTPLKKAPLAAKQLASIETLPEGELKDALQRFARTLSQS